jgi:hypothetical protein
VPEYTLYPAISGSGFASQAKDTLPVSAKAPVAIKKMAETAKSLDTSDFITINRVTMEIIAMPMPSAPE